ncbi:uncharacterized protein L3040_000340 [Drepanopeziza brunnea f. sp. 'multigermtubi']|uniref:Autophagy-related protein 2 n=1 Tax=Marssonina brunnea f. sp. multigermtubi (strain MB_m1) TaxID=1072389 RepID=K1XHA4_MARBU|nr:ATG C terminal domain-containing protein [Drepanopeziza brunnea f. sp. 'multigermtubi' MB_m1]EKD11854.1 ATG C terminal domain-containing protein [Drepanopeziza brunnea f. sp. 'multigermtubi' MB_m1]KAJ5054056.1 hypothetical protein L3040_000340 [Drepanopeziza brunnea f. sp. 'multigermtubi']
MASYFQSYFQASSMPKRLIQYVLSRIEILDTDALDLQNLDIAWGKNSTFEFKDVALRMKKLEALLQLPPSLELVKAQVILLRLTLPVDIYSSPIVVEVDGVESSLRVNSKSETGTHCTSRTNHDRIRNRPPGKSSGPPSRSYRSRRASESTDDEELDTAIPTAVDLAQSFLQAEPEEERAELEAAIMSETQEFGSASIMSEDGEIPVGTGAPLSLPNFMARFIQGIVDRLQVRISGITINLDIEVPNDSSRRTTANQADAITFQLKVENVDIEGVTHEEKNDTEDASTSKLSLKEGKRLVCLSKIRGALISEANFFSTLARSSAMSSPSATHSDIIGERRFDSKSNSSTYESAIQTSDTSSSDRSSTISSSKHSVAPLLIQSSELHSLRGSVVASDSGRFEDAPEDDEVLNMSNSNANISELGDSMYRDIAYLDQVTESECLQEQDNDEDGPSLPPIQQHSNIIRSTSPVTTPRASIHIQLSESHDLPPEPSHSVQERRPLSMLQSTILPTSPLSRFSQERISHSQPALSREPDSQDTIPANHDTSASTDVAEEALPDDEYDNSTPLAEQDLAQSQFFSHEEAESMYMSAISYTASTSRIPGGWAHSSSESEGPVSSPRIPTTFQIDRSEDQLDNLEHARHVAPQESVERHKIEPSLGSLTSSSAIPPSIRRPSSSAAYPRGQRVPELPQKSSDASERSTASSDEYVLLAKKFFDLDQVNIYLPAIDPQGIAEPAAVTSPAVGASSIFDSQYIASQSSVNVPGAFSSHLPAQQKPSTPKADNATPETKQAASSTDAIEVVIGKLLIHFDVSIGKLVFKVLDQLKDIFESAPKKTAQPPKPEIVDKKFSLGVEQISIKFLERLEGLLGSPTAPTMADQSGGLPSGDVLLQMDFSGLNLHSHASKQVTKTSITLKRFVFGYAQANIVCFDAGLQMRASVKDLRASDGIDVSINMTQTADTTRCSITTLPLHVSVDLQRLDETFSWFGGLSSVLNLGSSIASNATVTATSPSKPKSRGVRFETPIQPEDASSTAQNKADLRIGGFILDLVGTDCSIGVETSAVKLVTRDEGIGVSIQKIRLSGPHLKLSNDDPAISVDITGTRIEYLPTPNDADLDRLLSLITPSKAKYDQDDDILLETLLRQRKQGAVVKLTVDDFQIRVGRLKELAYLPELGEEVARLATVAKYLPEDDRPGLLFLVSARKFDANIDFGSPLGAIQLSSCDIEVAQITLPALVALSVGSVSARRNSSEDLLGMATDPELREPRARAPVIMARMIGDEMEPVVKIKLWNLKVEYRVPTLMTLMGLAENATPQEVSASLTASVATLTDFARPKASPFASNSAQKSSSPGSKPMRVDVILGDCILGMNPLSLPSKVLVVLTEAHLEAILPRDQVASASMELNKASILVIDNVAHLTSGQANSKLHRHAFDGGSTQVSDLCDMGYVSVSYISSAKAVVHMTTSNEGEQALDVELRDDLFVLESCADSTQTLIAVLGNLSPPTTPCKETKYRTKVIPVHDLLASLSGDAFGTAEGDYNFDDDFAVPEGLEGDFPGDDNELDFDSHYYQNESEDLYNADDDGVSSASTRVTSRDTHDGVLLDSFVQPPEALEDPVDLDFQEDHFGTGSVLEGTAHRWNSSKNTYDQSNAYKVRKSPLKVCIRDVHIIWNLFDGYDWQHTRDTITKAVQDVESKAIEKRARSDRLTSFDQDVEDEETVIGDFLFNSIYIGIPSNRDPRELAAAINQELNDNATETESIATTSLSSSPSRPSSSRKHKTKKLRLNRSRHHKITFELRGVCVDLVAFPPESGETQSSIDIRVNDFEIFDHVPTSTWRKFATYMQDAGQREIGTSMIHIEILNVKPVPELAAAEIVLKATVLPLRLHVDQDALDFITRFFEFKDDSAPVNNSQGDAPFLQRVEVNSVQVKLDFKPKRVDYAGLRSGHTTEFMNFLILDEADMVLRHTIIYGISGFDKLGKCLNDIWMPDIKRNQLPGILAGLAPVRSLVNVGGGFRHLVVVPMREYRKDGRIVRSISKGAAAFAKTTGTELVKLGAKVAIGVQTVLQGAEDLLGPTSESALPRTDDDDSEEEKKHISLYANQPVGVFQGLRGGYAGLQRDLVLARDAIIAVPGEVMEGGNAAGVLKAVRKHAPTVILRPAIGVARAGGQILMGATNSLDPVHLQRAEAKYKKH